ncbi:MAG: hypothetical protein ABIP97_03565 [Chthoniobacterales bacterium]
MIRCFLILLLFLSSFCRGAEPKPILVVLEQNPWLSVIGSDSPTFALYDDGSIYYLRGKPTTEEPFQFRTVKDAASKGAELLGFDPTKMKNEYEISSATDQITTVIWTPEKRIEVYGNWRKAREDKGGNSGPQWKAIVERERKMRESLPAEIRASLTRIDQERDREGKAWFAAKVEVMFCPYEYAPDASINWPKDWPDLTAKDTHKRGSSFSVFLPSEKLPDLRGFLATRKKNGAVLIDGKKMAVAIRLPFPAEEIWMR